MKIIQDWRKALHSYSAVALAALVALPVLWAELPPEIIALIPIDWHKWIVAAVAGAGFVGRFIKQGKDDGNP